MRKILWVAALLSAAVALPAQGIPTGFTNISPGAGPERVAHQPGESPRQSTAWKVEDGVVTGTQDNKDNGGIMLTDKKYKELRNLRSK